MNLNECIAETVSLAEYCEDKETKVILLSHLTSALSTQSQKLTSKIQEDPVDVKALLKLTHKPRILKWT